MPRTALHALSARAGIELRYHRNDGTPCETSDATCERLLAAMGIEASSEAQAQVALDHWQDASPETPAAAEDAACVPVGDACALGLSAQLYAVRRDDDLGAGDFGTLHALVDWAADVGASFVGINPLHALDLTGAEPTPYSPWSRLYLHALYVDLDAVPELHADAGARASRPWQQGVDALRAAERIDHRAVLQRKLAALEAAHRTFVTRQASMPDARGEAFAAFVAREGTALEDFARFAAIALHLNERDARRWPRPLQDARGDAVAAFAREHAQAIDLHRYIQFELDRQLGQVAAHATQRGLARGLYLDLAVGSTQGGAESWSQPTLFAQGVSLGAPPDAYASEGQTWQLAPLIPSRLPTGGFEAFTALLDHTMRHAGTLRIDHAMGLVRQFWVPEGCTAAQGAYVRFPAAALLDRVAHASQRHQCVVIGEDLGTVPEGFREEMARRAMLRSLVLYFERQPDRRFTAPEHYAHQALASANTHDLATLRGFWQGTDIDERLARGGIDAPMAAALHAERAHDRGMLNDLLRDSGLLDNAGEASASQRHRAVYTWLARTPAALVAVALDDLCDALHATNQPGAPDPARINWTRRLDRSLQALRADDDLAAWLRTIAQRAPCPG